MGKLSVEQLAEKLYELDMKVYAATGSKMGHVFPAGKEVSVNKLVKQIQADKKHFIRGETTLISNMIKTIKDSSIAAECMEELEKISRGIEDYSPLTKLPEGHKSGISVMRNPFEGGKHKIVCIGRQFGSGGHDIGFELAERLGIAYYDNDIIRMACEHMGKNIPDNDDDDEILSKKRYNPFKIRKFPGNDELFFAQSDMIQYISQREDCIFMGRCADVVLRHAGIPCISVFIGAPFDARVEHEMTCTGCTAEEATEKVRSMDKSRKAYYNYYTGRHWGHSENYDLCINTACYGIEGTVDMLEDIYKMF